MKKTFVFGVLALCLMGCQTLTIAVDKTDSEGVRTISTSNQHLYKYFDISLGVRLAQKDTIMGIIVTAETDKLNGVFDTDDRLLIQLNDGSEIVLRNILDRESYELRNETRTDYHYVPRPGWDYVYGPWGGAFFVTPYGATTCFENSYQTTVSDSYALYLVSYDEMMRIINTGVRQLRIEVDDDAPIMGNPGKVQGLFKNMFECLIRGVTNKGNW